MKISARNAFDGSVESVKPGAINSEVDRPSRRPPDRGHRHQRQRLELGLVAGKAVKALVKASSVLVLTDGAASSCRPATASKAR
jgi:molybdate transport system regulatory protein